ncbi:MAG: hypothetical protein U1E66_12755 [Rhodospirillales bacterium]
MNGGGPHLVVLVASGAAAALIAGWALAAYGLPALQAYWLQGYLICH